MTLALLLLAAARTSGTDSGRAAPAAADARRVAVAGGTYFEVDASGLASMLKNKDFLLVNVHVPHAGEIEPTDLFLEYDQMAASRANLPADKGAKIFVYCQSGHMSNIAGAALVKLGYTNVWHLAGGMMGWQQAGYPLAQKAR
ncbi:MAG: rhodanese-like domain-containing protein [Chloroflexota bacterium]